MKEKRIPEQDRKAIVIHDNFDDLLRAEFVETAFNPSEIDTHTFLWWVEYNANLSTTVSAISVVKLVD